MNRVLALLTLSLLLLASPASAQKKALFDNTKAETSGQADWIIDDTQPVPSPAQSSIVPTSPESYWTGGISAFGVALVKRGYNVATLTTANPISYQNAGNPYDLSNYDLFVVPEPNIRFTAAESTAIFNYVRDGGGLILIVDHGQSDRNNDGYDSPQIANLLDAQKLWGVRSQVFGETNNNIVQTSVNVNTAPGDSIITGPWGNATGIAFHNGTTFTLYPAINPTATGDVWMTGTAQGSTSNAMVAHSVYGNGRVVYVGDSSPVDDGTATPGNTVYPGWVELAGAKADSAIFMNAAQWATRRGAGTADLVPPTVSITSPNGGEAWKAGSSQTITWTASDNVAVTAIDLAYSIDGGATYPNTIATSLANSGSYTWTVPNSPGTTVRVRVTARDAASNSTAAASAANFTIDRWSIVASAGTGGTISPSGTLLQAQGSSRTFTITASSGYSIASVIVDGSSVGAVGTYTFSSIAANHTISASFTPVIWTINASAGPGGTISPSGSVGVSHGSSQGFVIIPDDGAHVADVLVDGGSVGAVTALTISNVVGPHTVVASFAPNAHTLSVGVVGGGSVARSPDAASYPYATWVGLTATPASGWAFTGWSGDTSAATNPLPMAILGDRTVTASFADIAPPVVNVAIPNGGETWELGATMNITWNASDNAGVDSVDVDYSLNGVSGPWQVIAHGLPNSGTHPWLVQAPATTHALVRVHARDAAANAASDTSDAEFTIEDPASNGAGDGPATLALATPWPNPSVRSAVLRFSLPAAAHARLEILDLAGRRVASLDGEFGAGRHEWRWDGLSAEGTRTGAGLYFVRLVTPFGTRMQRLARLD